MAKKNKLNGFSSFLNNPVDFTLVITTLLLVVAIVPRPKSPIEKWHNAIDQGMTWNEYIGGEKSE